MRGIAPNAMQVQYQWTRITVGLGGNEQVVTAHEIVMLKLQSSLQPSTYQATECQGQTSWNQSFPDHGAKIIPQSTSRL